MRLWALCLLLSSLPLARAMAEVREERFVRGPVAGVPGWSLSDKKSKSDAVKNFDLAQEGTNVFLRAHYVPGRRAEPLLRSFAFDPTVEKKFSWRWRVHQMPVGARTSDPKKEDSAAAVYVSLKSGMRSYVIKYIWSTQETLGFQYSKGAWNPLGSLRAVVIRTGGPTGTWFSESRDIATDFKTLFGKEIQSSMRVHGIGVLSDGDQTKSEVVADYDDFVADALVK